MCNNLTLLNFDRVAQGVEPCSTTFDYNRVTILEPAVSSEAAFIFVMVLNLVLFTVDIYSV